MPAALYGARETLQGVGCWVWAANLYLQAHTALGLKPFAKVACNEFNKQ
jgi:hypothetical protein